jgi:hypothetical protein
MDAFEYLDLCERLDIGANVLAAWIEADPDDVPLDVRHSMAKLAASFGITALEMGSPWLRLQLAQRVAQLKKQAAHS